MLLCACDCEVKMKALHTIEALAKVFMLQLQ